MSDLAVDGNLASFCDHEICQIMCRMGNALDEALPHLTDDHVQCGVVFCTIWEKASHF